MTVSVAVATYNGEKYIKKQLESILKQTVKVDEVVICDDCSTDRTADICNRFIEENNLSGWSFSVNEKNVGYCLNFYGAIEICRGDVIFLADQDDEWHYDKVEKTLQCLEKNTDITVLSSRYNVIDENSKIIENSGVTYLGNVFNGSVEYYTSRSFIGCSYVRGFSMCFKKELKQYLKPIDLQSIMSHDWYICFLGSLLGKTAVLNTKLTDYRYHFDNVSLSDMTRKKLIGSFRKRVNGLEESIEAHTYLTEFMDTDLKYETENFIAFEKKRLKFLTKKSIFLWFYLFFKINEYSRYYKGKGLKVWLGDFAYAYNINPNFRI